MEKKRISTGILFWHRAAFDPMETCSWGRVIDQLKERIKNDFTAWNQTEATDSMTRGRIGCNFSFVLSFFFSFFPFSLHDCDLSLVALCIWCTAFYSFPYCISTSFSSNLKSRMLLSTRDFRHPFSSGYLKPLNRYCRIGEKENWLYFLKYFVIPSIWYGLQIHISTNTLQL